MCVKKRGEVFQGCFQCHADVGWLKTVDQYYSGANNSIQNAGVQYTLDTVIQALEEDPTRRYIWVEIAFFERWWKEASSSQKELTKQLVQQGRLEFINGGWCMNDEASVHYQAVVDQMTKGHRFLLDNFGEKAMPRVAWHIGGWMIFVEEDVGEKNVSGVDPFGHTAAHPILFAEMGMDAFFFARIDYQDYALRTKNRELEMVWRPSQSQGSKVDMFTGVLYGHYCAPGGFDFDQFSNDPPLVTDATLCTFNIKERADEFAKQMWGERSPSFRHNHIMLTMGCDFQVRVEMERKGTTVVAQYQNAHHNFKNMDKLIEYINAHPEYNMTLHYSTPSAYVDAVHAENLQWKVKTDDFMPYADNEDSMWTGYFTSRVAIKGLVRKTSAYLAATAQLSTSARKVATFDWKKELPNVDLMERVVGVAQHHDAVSGTEKQHVACDYSERLWRGTVASDGVVDRSLRALLNHADTLVLCHQANVSVCPATAPMLQKLAVPTVLYNPLGYARVEYIQIPVPTHFVQVTDEKGNVVESQVNAVRKTPATPPASHSYEVWFKAHVPALGYATYFLRGLHPPSNSRAALGHMRQSRGVDALENEFLRVEFASGRLTSVTNKKTGQTTKITQEFAWYNASTGVPPKHNQASGAYIFRPNSSATYDVLAPSQPVEAVLVDGPLVQELRQTWLSSNFTQTFRLFKTVPHISMENVIGPIWFQDGWGREVITRFSTDLDTKQLWWTDSNGMEMQLRRYNYRPTWNLNVTQPVSGNYYPVNVAIATRDAAKNVQLTLVTDRSRGGASLRNGQLEVMMQRRLQQDDARGVGEALNETYGGIVTSKQELLMDPISTAAASWRPTAMGLRHRLIPVFAKPTNDTQGWAQQRIPSWSALATELPKNVHMLTLKTLDSGEILLRLHHMYGVGEDVEWSKPAQVDLSTLFSAFHLSDVVEYQLSGVRPLKDVHRLQWATTEKHQQPVTHRVPFSGPPGIIELNPMEIRTFVCRVEESPRRRAVNIA